MSARSIIAHTAGLAAWLVHQGSSVSMVRVWSLVPLDRPSATGLVSAFRQIQTTVTLVGICVAEALAVWRGLAFVRAERSLAVVFVSIRQATAKTAVVAALLALQDSFARLVRVY